jgi:hypothetical protein
MRITVKLVFSASLVAALPTMAQTPTDPPAAPDPISGSLATPDHRGTVRQPLVVTKPSEELRRDEFDQQRHEGNEHDTAVATKILAFFTLALWIANIWLVIVTRRTAAEQARHTQQAISEAKRSADAMRDVADATKNNATLMSGMLSKQMRAYLSVEGGQGWRQTKDVLFQGRPVITNNGLTPARNVCWKVLAGILDGSGGMPQLPDIGELIVSDMAIAPRQQFLATSPVLDRMSDEEAEVIAKGETRRLFVWGRVTYDDVFGAHWVTNFCVNYRFWMFEEKIQFGVTYSPLHNDST